MGRQITCIRADAAQRSERHSDVCRISCTRAFLSHHFARVCCPVLKCFVVDFLRDMLGKSQLVSGSVSVSRRIAKHWSRQSDGGLR